MLSLIRDSYYSNSNNTATTTAAAAEVDGGGGSSSSSSRSSSSETSSSSSTNSNNRTKKNDSTTIIMNSQLQKQKQQQKRIFLFKLFGIVLIHFSFIVVLQNSKSLFVPSSIVNEIKYEEEKEREQQQQELLLLSSSSIQQQQQQQQKQPNNCYYNYFFFRQLTVFAYNKNNYHYNTTSTTAKPSSSSNDYHTNDYVKYWLEIHVGRMTLYDYIFFCIFIYCIMEILNYISIHIGQWIHAPFIPVRGQHYDTIDMNDAICILYAKLFISPVCCIYYKYCVYHNTISWSLEYITFYNTVVPYIVLFIVYDLLYTCFHFWLHIPIVYKYIHKYHHQQLAPSRGNDDLYIIHPIEITIIQLLYPLTMYLVTTTFPVFTSIHFSCCVLWFISSGILADLSHTRYDITIQIPFLNITIYDTKDHDIHHRIPRSNYGLNIRLWDYVFRTHRSYNSEEIIYPKLQLDLSTGKTIGYNHIISSSSALKSPIKKND